MDGHLTNRGVKYIWGYYDGEEDVPQFSVGQGVVTMADDQLPGLGSLLNGIAPMLRPSIARRKGDSPSQPCPLRYAQPGWHPG